MILFLKLMLIMKIVAVCVDVFAVVLDVVSDRYHEGLESIESWQSNSYL